MFSKRGVRRIVVSALAVLTLLVVTSVGAAVGQTVTSTATCSSTTASATPQPPPFDPSTFQNSTKIDNKWYPLVPGTQFTLDGNVDQVPHRVVLTVTNLTKVINGVRSVVLWDRDFSGSQPQQLEEAELAFEAQDNPRNVWNLGEYPEEYENGMFVGAPSTWISGVAGAKAGFAMLANPQVGTSYVQGSVPSIRFLDVAKVVQINTDQLVIEETSPLDPQSGDQCKYYAPGVGNIRIAPAGGTEQESLDLTKIEHLNKNALAQARAEALKLDKHAYDVSNVYRHTPPAQ